MKKFLLSFAVLVVFALYAIRLRFGDDEESRVIVANVSPSPTSVNLNLTTPTTVPSGSSNPPASLVPAASTPKPQGKYKDGSYTGAVADAFYGNIQVRAVITGGKITDVIFLQYPNDRGTSIEINSQAMPILKQQAIRVQSAKVDGVSGATASSDAFVQSLGSALQQAI